MAKVTMEKVSKIYGEDVLAVDYHDLRHPRSDRGDDEGRQDRGPQGGIVQQVASPQQMYEHPVNVFVAGFIGSPAMNFIRARLKHLWRYIEEMKGIEGGFSEEEREIIARFLSAATEATQRHAGTPGSRERAE